MKNRPRMNLATDDTDKTRWKLARMVGLSFLLTLIFLTGLSLLAQGTEGTQAGTSGSFNFEWLAPLLAPVVESLAGKYGWIVQVLVVIGALRVAFKPVMFFLEQRDPENIGNFERGPVYKVISFILDFGASIKVNQINKPKL